MFKIGEINHRELYGAIEEEEMRGQGDRASGRLVVYRNNRAFVFGTDPLLNLF